MKNRKVLIGLSGGVDSTASALMLQNQGYEVIGLHFDVLGNQQGGMASAQKTADKLGIPLICKDVSADFQSRVIDYFCMEYMNGRTPNPCVMCNKEIKYAVMVQEADKQGADYIATGHYANIIIDENSGKSMIATANNIKKDQSYVLWRLSQEIVSRTLFPLGHVNSKEEIREFLRKEGFENAEKKDSQEICFITDDDYINFIKARLNFTPQNGNFIDKSGKVLGRHQGIINYTIGQRKGLGIALGKPAFVVDMDVQKNTVTLGSDEDLFDREIFSSSNNFIAQIPKYGSLVEGKIRYAAKPAKAKIYHLENGDIKTVFEDAQRAPTKGQSIVWYHENILLGGGFIK